MRESYLSETGKLIYLYDSTLDNYREAEQAAIVKHGLVGKKITTIAVTRKTDFLRLKNETINGTRQTGKPDTKGLTGMAYDK